MTVFEEAKATLIAELGEKQATLIVKHYKLFDVMCFNIAYDRKHKKDSDHD